MDDLLTLSTLFPSLKISLRRQLSLAPFAVEMTLRASACHSKPSNTDHCAPFYGFKGFETHANLGLSIVDAVEIKSDQHSLRVRCSRRVEDKLRVRLRVPELRVPAQPRSATTGQ